MKVLYITGCLGFIGSYVTRACLEQGWFVFGIDKISYASNIQNLEEFKKFPKFKFEQKDINEINRLVDCDYFINLAAETHVDNSIRDSRNFINSNIDGVHNILELLKDYRRQSYVKPTFIHFSTDEVYGDDEKAHVETDILKPSNPYSATKAAADQLILAWNRTYGIPYMIVRPTNNYGIGQYVEKLIPKSCKFLSIEKKIPVLDKGLPIRVWLHAKDTARAIITLIESGEINQIYNISGGYEQNNITTIKKLIDCYFKKSIENYEDYLDFDVVRPGHDKIYSLNDDKLRNLGWSPICNFDEELVGIVDHYKNNFIW